MSELEEQFELPAMPAPEPLRRRAVRVVCCTPGNYRASCRERYHGWTLRDALENWEEFEERRADFDAWVTHYQRDPYLRVGAKTANPEGTLAGMVWVMQTALEPDRSCLHPCLDFEEKLQRVFIRRGLLIYLTLLLKEITP